VDRATRNRLVRESDAGRQFGWGVDFRGRPVALLLDPVWDADSQFWHHYRLAPAADDPELRQAVFTPEFWEAHLSELAYRNLKLGEVAPNAFPRPGVFDAAGRVWMRGLYLTEE
jgi:hypothetical protein